MGGIRSFFVAALGTRAISVRPLRSCRDDVSGVMFRNYFLLYVKLYFIECLNLSVLGFLSLRKLECLSLRIIQSLNL